MEAEFFSTHDSNRKAVTVVTPMSDDATTDNQRNNKRGQSTDGMISTTTQAPTSVSSSVAGASKALDDYLESCKRPVPTSFAKSSSIPSPMRAATLPSSAKSDAIQLNKPKKEKPVVSATNISTDFWAAFDVNQGGSPATATDGGGTSSVDRAASDVGIDRAKSLKSLLAKKQQQP